MKKWLVTKEGSYLWYIYVVELEKKTICQLLWSEKPCYSNVHYAHNIMHFVVKKKITTTFTVIGEKYTLIVIYAKAISQASVGDKDL